MSCPVYWRQGGHLFLDDFRVEELWHGVDFHGAKDVVFCGGQVGCHFAEDLHVVFEAALGGWKEEAAAEKELKGVVEGLGGIVDVDVDVEVEGGEETLVEEKETCCRSIPR